MSRCVHQAQSSPSSNLSVSLSQIRHCPRSWSSPKPLTAEVTERICAQHSRRTSHPQSSTNRASAAPRAMTSVTLL